MHILLATNNFWVGGREDYIQEYTRYLSGKGYAFSLIASSISANTPALEHVTEIMSTGGEGYADRWQKWLLAAENLFLKKSFRLIWAHHFDLLPAWIFSRLHDIPLLVTFHGPLSGAGRPNDPMQALGMVLCIHRGGVISAVSAEISANISFLHPDLTQIFLLPNTGGVVVRNKRVEISNPPCHFVLITRREKLGHLRAAILLFHSYRKKVAGARLVIAAGSRPDDFSDSDSTPLSSITKLRELLYLLGVKWCLEQGYDFVRTLLKTNFIGYADNAPNLIQKADVVMGMGRVAINGLVQKKAVVLIGYEQHHVLISSENFEKCRWSNFSGRGVDVEEYDTICTALLSVKKESDLLSNDDLEKLDTPGNGSKLEKLVQQATSDIVIEKAERELAVKLKEILDSGQAEKKMFSVACSCLSQEELASFYQLCVG